MNIENDPRLTAYALGELGAAERQIFEQELANAGGASDVMNGILACVERIRAAYSAEPVYAMTAEQRAILLADADALPMPIPVWDGEVPHSDKVLPWVTQPVISEVDKQKIAEALKPSPWRRALPLLASLGVAASVLWLAAIVMLQEPPSVAKIAPVEEDEAELVPITIDTAGFDFEAWQRRRAAAGEPPLPLFRYGPPLRMERSPEELFADPQWIADGGMRDPSFESFRRSVFPLMVGVESYETVRQFMLAGMLPPADKVRVMELLNAFEYDSPAPQEGQTFAVDTEVAICPWDPSRQLLQIGLRAAEGDEPAATVAEEVRVAVEFNPATVDSYRLIGEGDAGKAAGATEPPAAMVPSGHAVTALYEVVPRADGDNPPLKPEKPEELLTVRVDYKETGSDIEQTVQATVADAEGSTSWREASDDIRFAASVAGYGLLLGADENKPLATYDLVLELARDSVGEDPDGRRKEFVEWIEKTIELKAKAAE